jgi:hypothetical protein
MESKEVTNTLNINSYKASFIIIKLKGHILQQTISVLNNI